MSALREQLSRRLRELEVEERAWPGRAAGSPWYEMRLRSPADVEEAVRLVRLAPQGLAGKA